MKTVVMIALILNVTGCSVSKGFDRGTLRDSLSLTTTTDQEIQAILELKPQLPAPFKLGVYLSSVGSHYRRDFWTDAEKNALLAYGNHLKEAGVISDIYLISDTTVHVRSRSAFPHSQDSGWNLKDLRLAAAR